MNDAVSEPELREAFASLAETAVASDECPEPERLWAAARGELGPGELRDVVDHTSWCAACAESWRLAVQLSDEAPGVAAAPAAPRRSRAAMPLAWRFAAAAAIAVGALGLFQLAGPGEVPMRDAGGGGLLALTPENEPLPRDAFVLSWRLEPAVPGAVYEISVTTDELEVLAREENLESPSFQVPAAALADLEPGRQVLWKVEARLPDGQRRGPWSFVAYVE